MKNFEHFSNTNNWMRTPLAWHFTLYVAEQSIFDIRQNIGCALKLTFASSYELRCGWSSSTNLVFVNEKKSGSASASSSNPRFRDCIVNPLVWRTSTMADATPVARTLVIFVHCGIGWKWKFWMSEKFVFRTCGFFFFGGRNKVTQPSMCMRLQRGRQWRRSVTWHSMVSLWYKLWKLMRFAEWLLKLVESTPTHDWFYKPWQKKDPVITSAVAQPSLTATRTPLTPSTAWNQNPTDLKFRLAIRNRDLESWFRLVLVSCECKTGSNRTEMISFRF